MMIATGLYCLAFTPKVNARLAQLQQSGKLTEEEVRYNRKVLKLAMVCSIVVGFGAIVIYAFRLYD